MYFFLLSILIIIKIIIHEGVGGVYRTKNNRQISEKKKEYREMGKIVKNRDYLVAKILRITTKIKELGKDILQYYRKEPWCRDTDLSSYRCHYFYRWRIKWDNNSIMHAIDDHIFVGIFTGKFSHDIVAFF